MKAAPGEERAAGADGTGDEARAEQCQTGQKIEDGVGNAAQRERHRISNEHGEKFRYDPDRHTMISAASASDNDLAEAVAAEP